MNDDWVLSLENPYSIVLFSAFYCRYIQVYDSFESCKSLEYWIGNDRCIVLVLLSSMKMLRLSLPLNDVENAFSDNSFSLLKNNGYWQDDLNVVSIFKLPKYALICPVDGPMLVVDVFTESYMFSISFPRYDREISCVTISCIDEIHSSVRDVFLTRILKFGKIPAYDVQVCIIGTHLGRIYYFVVPEDTVCSLAPLTISPVLLDVCHGIIKFVGIVNFDYHCSENSSFLLCYLNDGMLIGNGVESIGSAVVSSRFSMILKDAKNFVTVANRYVLFLQNSVLCCLLYKSLEHQRSFLASSESSSLQFSVFDSQSSKRISSQRLSSPFSTKVHSLQSTLGSIILFSKNEEPLIISKISVKNDFLSELSHVLNPRSLPSLILEDRIHPSNDRYAIDEMLLIERNLRRDILFTNLRALQLASLIGFLDSTDSLDWKISMETNSFDERVLRICCIFLSEDVAHALNQQWIRFRLKSNELELGSSSNDSFSYFQLNLQANDERGYLWEAYLPVSGVSYLSYSISCDLVVEFVVDYESYRLNQNHWPLKDDLAVLFLPLFSKQMEMERIEGNFERFHKSIYALDRWNENTRSTQLQVPTFLHDELLNNQLLDTINKELSNLSNYLNKGDDGSSPLRPKFVSATQVPHAKRFNFRLSKDELNYQISVSSSDCFPMARLHSRMVGVVLECMKGHILDTQLSQNEEQREGLGANIYCLPKNLRVVLSDCIAVLDAIESHLVTYSQIQPSSSAVKFSEIVEIFRKVNLIYYNLRES